MGDISARDEIGSKLEQFKAGKQWWSARHYLEFQQGRPDLDEATRLFIRQQLALCTYKDPELRRQVALDRAMETLLGDQNKPADVHDSE